MANVNGMIEKVKVKVKRSGLMETVVEKHSRGHPMRVYVLHCVTKVPKIPDFLNI